MIIYYFIDPTLWRSVGIWFLLNTLSTKEYLIWRDYKYLKKAKVGFGSLLFMKFMALFILIFIFVSSLGMIVNNRPNVYVLIGIIVFSTMYITTGKAVKLYRSR